MDSQLSSQAVPLEQRLRIRHKQLLSNFNEARIERTQANDATAADRLFSLRTELSNHRLGSETRIINALRENDVAYMRLEKASSSSGARDTPDTETTAATTPMLENNNEQQQQQQQLPMPSDDIHGPTGNVAENYEEVLALRRDRIVDARLRVVQIALDIRKEHMFRMERIEELERQLFAFEQTRQEEVEQLTRELVEGIISIAHVNVTQAQSIAQEVLVEENERALANNVGMTALFAKLRQHELLHFRGAMKQLRDVMSRNEERMVKSVLAWSARILAHTDRFRRPPGRIELVNKTREMVVQAGRNLKHVVANITAAVESLPRKPRPTATPVPLYDYYSTHIPLPESQVPCDIPGGTGDGGWLRHFQIDDPRALQPFKKTPEQVTLEWTQALETVLDHFGTGSEETILASQQHGAMINSMAQTIVDAMRADIKQVFVPGDEEQRLRDTGAEDYFPFFEAPPTRRQLRKEERDRRRAVAWRKVAELDVATQQQLDDMEQQAAEQQQQGKGSGRNAAAASSNKRGNAANLQKMQEQLQQQQQAEREKLVAEAEAKSSDEDENDDDDDGDDASENASASGDDTAAADDKKKKKKNKSSSNDDEMNDVYQKYEFVSTFIFDVEHSQREIQTEAKWFADFLALHLLRQFEVANDAVHRNGFHAICTEATALLQGAAQRVCRHVRAAVLWQEESQKDFRDSLTRLERAYQLTEERLAAAGTITEATKLCEQAAGLLHKIEEAYTSNYNRSAEYLGSFASATLPQLLEQEAASIFAALSVQPVDLKKMQEEEDARRRAALEKEKELAAMSASQGRNRGAGQRTSPKRSNTPTRRGAAAASSSSKDDGESSNSVAQFLAKHSTVQSMRGGTYIVTAPADGIMELGGSLAEYLLRQQIEEAEKGSSSGAGAAAGGKQKPGSRQGSAAPPVPASPAAPAAGRTKMTKQQREELERLKLEEAARREAEQASKKLLPHEDRFLQLLDRDFSGIFTPQCLIAPSALPTYVGLLRSMVLDWYEEYKATSRLVSATYTKSITDQLSLETHECIRRHARRPVTLQSQVFEVRIRELQDAADARADWFQRLMHRAQRAAETALRGIADTEVIVAGAGASLEDLREEVCDAATVAAIDAQSRALAALLAEHAAHMKGAVDGVVAKCEEHNRAVSGEVTFFEQEKLKTLEEGGALTDAERAICERAIHDVNGAVAAARDEVQRAAAGCLAQSDAKVSEWRDEFETLLEMHRREVNFLREVGDQLTKTRGTISVMLSQSGAAQSRLSGAVGRLELFAAGGNDGGALMVPERTEAMAQLRAVSDFCKSSFAPAAPSSSSSSAKGAKNSSSSNNNNNVSKKPQQQQQQRVYDTEDGQRDEPAQERVRSALLQHRVAREKTLLHGSRVAKLAELMVALRFMLAERGLTLGCLSGLPEWVNQWVVAAPVVATAADGAADHAAVAGAASSSSSSSLDAVSGNWLSLDYAKTYMEASSAEAVAAAAAAAAAGGGGRTSGRNNRGGPSSPTKPSSRGKLDADAQDASSSGSVPPMRNSTVRMEWQAQKLLDKTEREIARLVAAHFKPAQTPEQQQQQQLAAAQQQHGRGGGGAASKQRDAKAAAAAAAAEQQQQQQDATLAHHHHRQLPAVTSVTRSGEYGADAPAIKERVAKLLVDQLGRVTDHVTQNTNEYRVLVRKMQVAIHGAVEELFAALLHFQLSTLNEGVRIILSDFEAIYRKLLEEQRQIQLQLRAPLAAPSHAREWQALCVREARRRAAAKYELEQLATNVATELVQSGRVANVRVVQALAAFFSVTKSYVQIRHLDGSEESLVPETGQHRGLRRLLRLKLREEVGGPKVVAPEKEGAANDKKKATGGKTAASAASKKGAASGGGARRGDSNAADPNAAGQSNDAPDPLPLPSVAPPQAPPVHLMGITAGRTIIPESSPEIAIAIQQRAMAEAAAAAAPPATPAAGASKVKGNKAAAAAAVPAPPSSSSVTASSSGASPAGDTPSGVLLNLCVPASPAAWLDDASQFIFKQVALLAAQSAAEAAAAAAASASGNATTATAAQKGVGGVSGTTPRGGNAKDAAAAAAAAAQQQALLASSFFDPSVPYKSGTFQVPGGGNSETRIFPVAYSAAQLSIDKMDQVLSEAAALIFSKLQQFEEVESRWCVAWNSAAESLGATSSSSNSQEKKILAQQPPAAAAPTKPARA